MKTCLICKKIIVEDFEKWREENPESNYLECPYCNYREKI